MEAEGRGREQCTLFHPLKSSCPLFFFFRLSKKHLLCTYSVPATVVSDGCFMIHQWDTVSALKEFNFLYPKMMQSLLNSDKCETHGMKWFQSSSIIKGLSLLIPSSMCTLISFYEVLEVYSSWNSSEKETWSWKSWGEPFQLPNPGRIPRVGRRWWLQVGYRQSCKVWDSSRAHHVWACVALKRRTPFDVAAEQSSSPGKRALLKLEPRPVMHMAGFENVSRLQSACLHSMLLPCSLKGLQNTRAQENRYAWKCLSTELRETQWWSIHHTLWKPLGALDYSK